MNTTLDMNGLLKVPSHGHRGGSSLSPHKQSNVLCNSTESKHCLAWANFGNVVMLAHICEILIEILNTVTV